MPTDLQKLRELEDEARRRFRQTAAAHQQTAAAYRLAAEAHRIAAETCACIRTILNRYSG